MREISRRRFIRDSSMGLGGLTLLDTSTAGCGGGRSGPAVSGLSSISMQSAWVNDAEFLGYFVALENGWYEEEGLDMTYLSGGPEIVADSVVLAGRAEIALTTPDTTINAIVNEGAPFKIIGAQYQKNPLGVVSLASSAINEPSDLVGKTLAVPPANMITAEALLRLNGLGTNAVEIVPYQYDPTPLIQGEVDATIDFVTNVPYTIRERGAEPSSFLLYDFGFTIYNDTVTVTEETLVERRSDLVKWLRASRRGWEENFRNPTVYPARFADSYFAGTGRTVDNEIFFNNAQRSLMESESGVFALTEEGIEANNAALQAIGINATREMFATDLLAEI